MTNALAIWIGIILVGCIAVDAVLFEWSNSIFLARKFVEVLRWMAFWR